MSGDLKATIFWTRAAVDDRSWIWHYYWDNWGEERAETFNRQLNAVLRRVRIYPFASMHDPGLGIRRLPIDRASRIYYDHRSQSEIIILALMHAAFFGLEAEAERQLAIERAKKQDAAFWKLRF